MDLKITDKIEENLEDVIKPNKELLEYAKSLYPEIMMLAFITNMEDKLELLKKLNLSRHAKERKIERDIPYDIKKCDYNKFIISVSVNDVYKIIYEDITFIINEEFNKIITLYKNNFTFYEWKDKQLSKSIKGLDIEIKKIEEKKNILLENRKSIQNDRTNNKVNEIIKFIELDNDILEEIITREYIPRNSKRNILEKYIKSIGGSVSWDSNVNTPETVKNTNDIRTPETVKNTDDIKTPETVKNTETEEIYKCEICDRILFVKDKKSHESSKKHKKKLNKKNSKKNK